MCCVVAVMASTQSAVTGSALLSEDMELAEKMRIEQALNAL